PVASAGEDQTVNEGTSVTLHGSGTDPDGFSIASYKWTQISGTPVTLSSSAVAVPTFTAPDVVADTTLTFQLKVTDNLDSTGTDTCNIQIKWVNTSPAASAGEDQTVNEGTSVTLHGSGTDPDGFSIASYEWTQTSGTPVTLSSSAVAESAFTAPEVTASGSLTFRLRVTDSGGLTAEDTCDVTVSDISPQTSSPSTSSSSSDSSSGGGGGGSCFISTLMK
ncbi:MAG: PKD domain-containing protein, partial [Pseudomonadota bacterium]